MFKGSIFSLWLLTDEGSLCRFRVRLKMALKLMVNKGIYFSALARCYFNTFLFSFLPHRVTSKVSLCWDLTTDVRTRCDTVTWAWWGHNLMAEKAGRWRQWAEKLQLISHHILGRKDDSILAASQIAHPNNMSSPMSHTGTHFSNSFSCCIVSKLADILIYWKIHMFMNI